MNMKKMAKIMANRDRGRAFISHFQMIFKVMNYQKAQFA
ncbi:Phage-associated cell wall hydrolase [Lactococcus raffinolactis 4877]|nr:Phage-associated cell wall hydrolase [Lactococcus raffinolactis 4877]